MLALILGIALIVVTCYLFFLLHDLKDILKQLTYICTEETNAELVSTAKNSVVRQILDQNNQLIRKNKTYYREQRQKEKQLHQLMSNLTHDLKTPLTVASGYTQILLKNTLLTEENEMVQKVDNSLTSIAQYLSYLMEYNLVQEKSLALELASIDLTDLLRENLFTYYDDFQARNLELTLELAETVPVISDRTVLQRVFQNILGNMLKHGYAFATINLHQTDEALIFTFTNGVAHTIADADQLFDRFHTEDASRTNKSTGLGLHIVKELVTLLAGTVTVQTEKETFCLCVTLKRTDKLSNS